MSQASRQNSSRPWNTPVIELAQSRLGLPKSITGVFQGLLLFCLLACDTLVAYRIRWDTGLGAARKGQVA